MTTSVEDAMALVVEQAMLARDRGTYGVGALLLSKSGEMLKEIHNNVIINDRLNDPTAHAERQLVDWYYSQPKNTVPCSEDVILITSLDPCCMCAGAILVAGFKVIVVANDTYAGINFDLSATFPSLGSKTLQLAARQAISYPAVIGSSSFARSASGPSLNQDLFASQAIDHDLLEKSYSTFEGTLATVKEKVYSDITPDNLLDVSELHSSDPLVVALKKVYPRALQYRTPLRYSPDLGLAEYLRPEIAVDLANGGDGNAVALLDHFGNLILCCPGNRRRSPIHTAFMLCTRLYSRLRASLSFYPSVERYLHPPRFGTFVFAIGPDRSAHSFMDLGAYGSTMEGPLWATNPHQLQYVKPSLSKAELNSLCAGLPPLYSQEIALNPTQVTDQRLIAAI